MKNSYLKLEDLERERGYNAIRSKRKYANLIAAAHDSGWKRAIEEREQEVRELMEQDPDLQGLSPWERAVMETVLVLADNPIETMLIARLRRQGRASLTIEAMTRALKRLERQGLVRAVAVEAHGTLVRGWIAAPEED